MAEKYRSLRWAAEDTRTPIEEVKAIQAKLKEMRSPMNKTPTAEQLGAARKCNCHSYNGDATNEGRENVPEIVVKAPDGYDRESISLDACIADTIQELWRRGLHTLNSCCGHNKMRPSIVICDDIDPQEYHKALNEIDPRDWEISRWERVVHKDNKTKKLLDNLNIEIDKRERLLDENIALKDKLRSARNDT